MFVFMKIAQSSLLYLFTLFLITSIGLFSQNQPNVEKVTFLGVSASTLSERMSEQLNLPRGIHLSVNQVSPDSPAEQAGLKLYDILLKLDDQILVNSDQLKALVRLKNPDDLVQLKILRKGKSMTLEAKLAQSEVALTERNGTPQRFHSRRSFPGDPFSQDPFFRNNNSSIMDLLKKHGFNHLPGISQNSPLNQDPFDIDNPLHGPSSNPGNVQSFNYSSEQKQIITTDEQGTLEYSVKDQNKHLRVTSPDGEVLFDGPVNTDEDRKNLSKDLHQRLEKLESRL
jgi:membrane-associated protease RseP (regulator of RpoE activity)